MADADLVASLAETVSALGLEKIPDKLHCNACHKFNVNAYKTTCCDTVICESCFTSRCDISCPICDHKPFNSDVCKPNKAMRTTVKSYLKTIEKAKLDAKIAFPLAADNVAQPEQTDMISTAQGEVNGAALPAKESELTKEEARETTPAIDVQPSIEDPDQDAYEPDEDHVEIQVEAEEDLDDIPSKNKIVIEDLNEDSYGTEFERHDNNTSTFSNGQDQATTNGMDGNDFANMMNGFNNMDYNQMMQMMAANGMGNFNPMMGLPMGMNTMSSGMFGGFGGPNSGMNGMNSMDMSMNFNPNQGMYSGWNNGQNNNMWQNNNANAFSNGMGGDFGSNYAFNMAQSGNFQQQYPNGDFQNGYSGRGYGRGRGRGRSGYGRGRGNFNQYSQFQQQPFSNGPNQYDNQGMRSQNTNDHKNETSANETMDTNDATNAHEDDEFAPGGQDDIQEALGEDYQKSTTTTTTTNNEKKTLGPVPSTDGDSYPETASTNGTGAKGDLEGNDYMQEDGTAPVPIQSVATDDPTPTSNQQRPIPAAYEEDLQGPMPPPSAPLGPAAQYDYGYRSRGHGRFAQRGRGLLSMQNGHSTPPVKSSPQISQPTPGVVGAPTGPRAMREPPASARPASRPSSVGNGFQIMGRASLDSPKRPESRGFEAPTTVKPSAPSEHDEYRDRDDSGRNSRQQNHPSSKYGLDEHDSDDRNKEKDRRHRRSSKRSTYDEHDRDERQSSIGASDSAERKSSRRNRADKEPTSASSKHQTSRSRAYHEEDANVDYEMEDYEGSSRSYRDAPDGGESRSRHRSSRISKYDDRRDRDRDHSREKDKPRDRDRDRERDKDRDREDRHREKERDRKRSRHDRHREDDKDYDKDYDYQNEADDHESRHRSRRHKRDHHRRHENDDYPSTAVTSTNRSHRSSAAGTPAPVASAVSHSTDKDPHTLEREARNRERMLKEQQRREKAAAKTGPSGGGGNGEHHSSRGSGRRVTYKYEDDIERSLAENERSSARWR